MAEEVSLAGQADPSGGYRLLPRLHALCPCRNAASVSLEVSREPETYFELLKMH